MATRKEDDEDEEPRVETYQWLSDGAIREMLWTREEEDVIGLGLGFVLRH